MLLRYAPYSLQFKHPFGVSSNTRKETLSLFLQLQHEGLQGYGEACLPAYLGESGEQTARFFEQARPLLNSMHPAASPADLLQELDLLAPGHTAAKAAIEMAYCDLQGKRAGLPVYALLCIGKSEAKSSSFTIGIDVPEKLEQKIREAEEFAVLKIKAGTADDKELIRRIRQYTDKPLYVDVNQGWSHKEEVLEMICWMKDQQVVLIEQPMPKERKEDMRWVTERSPLPTIADESVKRLADLEQLDGSFSGINIKLMKCAGLGEALKMIRYCRDHQLQVLLGCMAESSCGTSAMAQLMGLADHIDLDAPLLYTNDPFAGIRYALGKVQLSQLPGIGVTPVHADLFL